MVPCLSCLCLQSAPATLFLGKIGQEAQPWFSQEGRKENEIFLTEGSIYISQTTPKAKTFSLQLFCSSPLKEIVLIPLSPGIA